MRIMLIIKVKKFSQLIKEWRTMHNLTQDDAANYLNISRRTLQGYESGDRYCPPVKETFYREKISEFFDSKNSDKATYRFAEHDSPAVQEPTAIYRENELLKDIIKAKDELIAILREQLNNLKS